MDDISNDEALARLVQEELDAEEVEEVEAQKEIHPTRGSGHGRGRGNGRQVGNRTQTGPVSGSTSISCDVTSAAPSTRVPSISPPSRTTPAIHSANIPSTTDTSTPTPPSTSTPSSTSSASYDADLILAQQLAMQFDEEAAKEMEEEDYVPESKSNVRSHPNSLERELEDIINDRDHNGLRDNGVKRRTDPERRRYRASSPAATSAFSKKRARGSDQNDEDDIYDPDDEDIHRSRSTIKRHRSTPTNIVLTPEEKHERMQSLMKQTDQYLKQLNRLIAADASRANEEADAGSSDVDMNTTTAPTSSPQPKDTSISPSPSPSPSTSVSSALPLPSISIPHLLSHQHHLQPHQIEGLAWLVSLHRMQLQGGILADEMGLGKTMQTIAFLAHLASERINYQPHLIIAPLSTIDAWITAFTQWFPSCRVALHRGLPEERRSQLMTALHAHRSGQSTITQHITSSTSTSTSTSTSIPKGRAIPLNTISTTTSAASAAVPLSSRWDVLLTTYDMTLRDELELSKFQWNVMVVDEAHRLKNRASKLTIAAAQFKTNFRLLLTGTPLQNNLPELWSLLHFVLPTVFPDFKMFDTWFNTPFTSGSALSHEEQAVIVTRLHAILRPFLLRRVKEEVLSNLPTKQELVIRCPMSGLQHALYEYIQNRGRASMSNDSGGRAKWDVVEEKTNDGPELALKVGGFSNIVMQLRKVCNHPWLYRHDEEYDITTEIVTCGGKMVILHEMIHKLIAAKHRMLIFCQMTRMMTIIGEYLDMVNIPFLRLDGSTKASDRGALIDQFNAKGAKYPIALISTRAGGCGINLQSADTVILFDSDWNPQVDAQAQARVHRIGQTRDVRVYRLITANSIEEYIHSRGQDKLCVEHSIIGTGQFDLIRQHQHHDRTSLITQVLSSRTTTTTSSSEESDMERLNEILAGDEKERKRYDEMDQPTTTTTKKVKRGRKSADTPSYDKNDWTLSQSTAFPSWLLATPSVTETETTIETDLPRLRTTRSQRTFGMTGDVMITTAPVKKRRPRPRKTDEDEWERWEEEEELSCSLCDTPVGDYEALQIHMFTACPLFMEGENMRDDEKENIGNIINSSSSSSSSSGSNNNASVKRESSSSSSTSPPPATHASIDVVEIE